MNHSTPGLPVHHQLQEFIQTHVHKLVMPSSHLILCHSLLLLPPIPPSIRVFSNESTLHMRWPKYWSFSFSISPSSEHPGLISCRVDWLDLLAAQGTLKSLLQSHSIIAAAAEWLQSCPTLCNPMTAAHQAPPSLRFSRQEHWSGLPFPYMIVIIQPKNIT